MAKAAPNNLAHVHRDRGYRFVDRDPVMEEVSGAITRSGRSLEWISKRSGVSVTTLANWMSGKTRRPQHLTVSFVMSSLGYQETWTQVGQVEDMPIAQVQPMSFADAFPRISVDKYDQFLRNQVRGPAQ